MDAHQQVFARIGRSFPSEVLEPLYQAALHARRERQGRAQAWDEALRGDRTWRGSGEPIDVPMRLSV